MKRRRVELIWKGSVSLDTLIIMLYIIRGKTTRPTVIVLRFVIEFGSAGKEKGPFKVGEFGREGVGRFEGATPDALRVAFLTPLRTLGTLLHRIVARRLKQRHLLSGSMSMGKLVLQARKTINNERRTTDRQQIVEQSFSMGLKKADEPASLCVLSASASVLLRRR